MKTSLGDKSEKDAVPFGSNAIRLGVWEWIVVALIVVGVLILAPKLWQDAEPFAPASSYRVPFSLSNDYWVYDRLAAHCKANEKIMILGDSVVWGEYVSPDHSFSQVLNRLEGSDRFVNGGLSGAHPLALEGLIRYYAHPLRDGRVILHCNLLWLSSAERDLSEKTDRDVSFNHPDLVPQFIGKPAVYHAKTSDRLRVVVNRRLRFRTWVNHLRAVSFEGLDIHAWSIDHPHENPMKRITFDIPQPAAGPRHIAPGRTQAVSWSEAAMEPRDLPWVNLAESLQWAAFQRIVRLLESRNNEVFVIVGPLNEHMLTEPSRRRYQVLKDQAQQWLREEDVSYQLMPLLPSEAYGDASHPLADGYERVASQLYRSDSFAKWLGRVGGTKRSP